MLVFQFCPFVLFLKAIFASVLKKMRKGKRRRDDLSRSSRQNRRVCKNKLVSGCFLGDSNQDVWTGLSDELKSYLSKRIASITVRNGRGVSGEMMAKSVELNVDSRVSEDDDDLDCKISEAWEGGPLVSIDRNIVGMNLFLTMKRAVFLPWGTILKHLEHYWTSRGLAIPKNCEGSQIRSKIHRSYQLAYANWPIMILYMSVLILDLVAPVHGDFLNQEQLELDSMGYPKLPSTMLEAGMILDYSFEETFGNVHGKGEKRFFACTGFFIEWNGSMIILTSASLVRNSGDENKIVENLRVGAHCSEAAVLQGGLCLCLVGVRRTRINPTLVPIPKDMVTFSERKSSSTRCSHG
nr:unnamed protein product [Digitaria exilis]